MIQTRSLLVGLTVLGLCAISACTSHRGGPPTEKVLRIPSDAKIKSLDPATTTDVYSAVPQMLVYDSVYEIDYYKRPYEPKPALAESMPILSKDFKTFTVKLKKGVHFADDPCFKSTGGKGPEVTADDVVYFFERVANAKLASPYFGNFEGRVLGIDDFHAGKAQSITGVKALDRYTVQVQLSRAQPRFILNFINNQGAILPKECVETLGDRLATHPVGTGPYKVVEANLSAKIVLEKNPTYREELFPGGHGPDSGKRLPLADKVVIEVFSELQPKWLKFKSGELDEAQIPKDFIPSEIVNGKPSEELARLGVQFFHIPRGDVTTCAFNLDDPVWGKKKELRQAFALALDVPDIIHFQYSDQAIRAQTLIDPTTYGYDPAFKSRWAERNLAKAKELLAKAGYPDGKGLPPIIEPTQADTTQRQLDERFHKELREVGIEMKPEPMTWPEFDKRARTKNFTMVCLGFASTSPDFDDLCTQYVSRNAAPGPNWPSYRNPEVDKLCDRIEELPNGAERLKLIRKFKELTDEDLPYVPLTHRVANQFFQKWVRNAQFMDNSYVGGFVKYLGVDVAQEKK